MGTGCSRRKRRRFPDPHPHFLAVREVQFEDSAWVRDGVEHLFIVDLHLVGAAGLQSHDEGRFFLVQRYPELARTTAARYEIESRSISGSSGGVRNSSCAMPGRRTFRIPPPTAFA